MEQSGTWYCGHCGRGPTSCVNDTDCAFCVKAKDGYATYAKSDVEDMRMLPDVQGSNKSNTGSSGNLSIPPAPTPGNPEPNAILRFWNDQGPWKSRAFPSIDGTPLYGPGLRSHEPGRVNPASVSYASNQSNTGYPISPIRPPAPMTGDPEPNALLRFWSDQGPWNSQAVAGPEGAMLYGYGLRLHEPGRVNTASNQSDTSSSFSVPSMFSGTTLSSLSSTYGKINVATEELVALLHNHNGLRPLFDTALQLFKPTKFERHFTKLLKIYALELRQEAANELEKAAVRLVYSQRKFVANCIRRVYVPDSSDTAEELQRLITQNPAKDQQLETFFDGMGLVPKALPAVADPDDGQSSDDSDMGDPEQPYLPNLTQVRKFMISGVAFENLRKNLDRFLNPRNKGDTISSVKVRPDLTDGLVVAHSESLDATSRQVSSGSTTIRNLQRYWNRWRRPMVWAGYRRLEWICVRLPLSFQPDFL